MSDFNHINNFLDKFKKILFQKEEIKNIVTKIISEEISFPLEKDKIKIKKGIIFIEGSPVLRNEIMLQKKQILIKIKTLLPDIVFLDIK